MYHPTWKELSEILQSEYGVTIELVKDPDTKEEFVYAKRMQDKELIHTLPFILNNHERVTADVVRNICRNLNIDPSDFGLILG